jgi:hypothetical protein
MPQSSRGWFCLLPYTCFLAWLTFLHLRLRQYVLRKRRWTPNWLYDVTFQTTIMFIATLVRTSYVTIIRNQQLLKLSVGTVSSPRTLKRECVALFRIFMNSPGQTNIAFPYPPLPWCCLWAKHVRYKKKQMKQIRHFLLHITAISHINYTLCLLSIRFPVLTRLYGKHCVKPELPLCHGLQNDHFWQ